MSSSTDRAPVVVGRDLRKIFKRDTGETVRALDGVSLQVEPGTLTALVGPDGAGKTTLLRLITGLLTADGGELHVLGIDAAADPQQIQESVGYMPQRFGLYEDLTVQENLDLYADMHGISWAERKERYPRLMAMTALGSFTGRLAGQLSGGMKQKLGLACTLIRVPRLLILDEPTVGVDPLSRLELWQIMRQFVDEGLSVLISTSYFDEAERCGHVIVLHQGKLLAHGPPQSVSDVAKGRTFLARPPAEQTARGFQAKLLDDPGVIDAVPQAGQVRFVKAEDREVSAAALAGAKITAVPVDFEDAFMVLLRKAAAPEVQAIHKQEFPARPTGGEGAGMSGEAVVRVHDLVKKFGSFTAVDHVSFEVRRGEIFGLLGPNGAGKTTTFRMICGLLAASSGTLEVAHLDLHVARASARSRIGYVAQKFSLYGQLSVRENLQFFARAYGLSAARMRERIDWALMQFELGAFERLPAAQLPGGFKQRLSMAAALLHEPKILFLDEPTSGADPLARREFWKRITALAEEGVTVIVTTHFMQEAEYCDRVAILDAGKVLAQGTPAEIRGHARPNADRPPTMEDAFIAIVEQARGETIAAPAVAVKPDAEAMKPHRADRGPGHAGMLASGRRVFSLVRKEGRQILRDPSSIAIGIVLPAILILLFGYGVSLDVKDIAVAVVVEERSPEAMDVAAGFQLSPYFSPTIVASMHEARQLMADRKVDGIIRLRPDFARNVHLGEGEVEILVQGSDANYARIVQAYAQGAVDQWLVRKAAEGEVVAAGPVGMRDRLWFNEANESHYFLVPGLVVLVMTLIGATLTALVMAREWERGTFEALFVTPVRSEEILLGKTIPYFALGMIGLGLCLFAAKFLFQVPFRGSVLVLAGTSMLYLLVALTIGLAISSATKSQFVASQITMLVTFLPAMMLSGFLFDLRSMPAAVRTLTYALPARYYVSLLQTVFLAGDVWGVILPNAAILAGMAAVLVLLTRGVTRKKLA